MTIGFALERQTRNFADDNTLSSFSKSAKLLNAIKWFSNYKMIDNP